MIVPNEREKLENAIIYFSENTEYCGKIKLIKLLYFLDFRHYGQIGRSVTGLTYQAWKNGPCPRSLHEEIDQALDGSGDMSDKIAFRTVPTEKEREMVVVLPKAKFDDSIFSTREMNLFRAICAEYKNARSVEMIDATHVIGSPWQIVYEQMGLKDQDIPYDLAIAAGDEATREVAADRANFIAQLA